MRDSLFISHSTPEDNDFVKWLSTRLTILGYKVWCDLNDLRGGEKDFWKIIDNEIRNNSIKFILVVSKDSLTREGVLDEYELAKSIEKEIVDFIIPVRIEDVPHNSRIGLNRYNQIDFFDWAYGLKRLLSKLQEDNVPCCPNKDGFKIRDLFANKYEIKNKREKYYSNLWEIKNIPDHIYCFQYQNETHAEAILSQSTDYPIIRHGNILESLTK